MNQPLAQEVFQETCTAEFFERWLTTHLLPALKERSVIILDNARFHRKSILFELVTQYNACHHTQISLLFLPPYSPDFNPIEHYWANLKKRIAISAKEFKTLEQNLKFNFV